MKNDSSRVVPGLSEAMLARRSRGRAIHRSVSTILNVAIAGRRNGVPSSRATCGTSELAASFQNWRPFAVMDFAAYAYAAESNTEPLRYYENNVGGTAKLLHACRDFGCKNFYFAPATYGIPARLPLRENDPQNPVNPYGRTKLIVERMLVEAEVAHGIKHVTLRYFNAAGADPGGELALLTQPRRISFRSCFLPPWVAGRQSRYSANDYPTPDGSRIRDYGHVSDLARSAFGGHRVACRRQIEPCLQSRQRARFLSGRGGACC